MALLSFRQKLSNHIIKGELLRWILFLKQKMDIILETKDLIKTYVTGINTFNAVNHTSIRIERGDFVTIVGKSGSGKSTLLHLIGGLDSPTSGEIWIDNECITKMSEEDLSAFRRRKIGFIFQAFNLVPSLNVWENIILPIGLDDKKPDMPYLKEIIEMLGLTDKLTNLPNTLSGGQQQRVAIARNACNKTRYHFSRRADRKTSILKPVMK